MKKFIDKLVHKLDVAKEESDFSYFISLLVVGECITKLIVLISIVNLHEDKNRHRYRILHSLVRANGVGDWSKAIDDLMTGTASQHIKSEFRDYQKEIIQKNSQGSWQFDAVHNLAKTLELLGGEHTIGKGKVDLKSWFKIFSELRNKTRGHGALVSSKCTASLPYFEKSIIAIMEELSLFDIPSAFIKRNLSGKYRVSNLSETTDEFDYLKTHTDMNLSDGLYIYIDGFQKIPLIESDPELSDFYIANGAFSNTRFEYLSYLTDNKCYGDSTEYMHPIGELPASESKGLGELVVQGNVFSNVPSISYEYIERKELENELFDLLLDDRRPVITLLGRGGIGKTSLALRVLPRLFDEERFDLIVWFSSRDIDLHSSGAKLVQADVVSIKDFSRYYAKLVISENDLKSKDFNIESFFKEGLSKTELGNCLFVFDNFETTSNPYEVFKWVDTYIRLPNKILITTRLREFKGDYPIQVHGMTEPESFDLIDISAKSLGVEKLISPEQKQQIFDVSAGHPYMIKIMVAELSKKGMKGSIPKIVASSDEVLTALFERTYSSLNPCAQRVYLTLSSWNSAVSRIVLEAVIMISIEEPQEVERAIETLIQYSLIDEFKSDIDGQYFLSLPYTAYTFGQQKLSVHPLKSAINIDSRLLQRFGVLKYDKKATLLPHVENFLKDLEPKEENLKEFSQLIGRIGQGYNQSYKLFARWLSESNDLKMLGEAEQYLYMYLEHETNEKRKSEGWLLLADICDLLEKPFDEVNALIEATQNYRLDFIKLSTVINKVNHLLNKEEIKLDRFDVKTEILSKLYEVAITRLSEADAVGCSRIAWLALHLNDEKKAKDIALQGLKKDPDDRYCRSLVEKLKKVET